MPQYFFDSSALVKRYRLEAGTANVRALVGQADRLVISRLGHVETAAAIVRRGRGDAAPMERIASALHDLDEDVQFLFELVELSDAVMAQAHAVVRRHGLRAADAIQLACAMIAQSTPGESLVSDGCRRSGIEDRGSSRRVPGHRSNASLTQFC